MSGVSLYRRLQRRQHARKGEATGARAAGIAGGGRRRIALGGGDDGGGRVRRRRFTGRSPRSAPRGSAKEEEDLLSTPSGAGRPGELETSSAGSAGSTGVDLLDGTRAGGAIGPAEERKSARRKGE
jgi:hypothetical protein